MLEQGDSWNDHHLVSENCYSTELEGLKNLWKDAGCERLARFGCAEVLCCVWMYWTWNGLDYCLVVSVDYDFGRALL